MKHFELRTILMTITIFGMLVLTSMANDQTLFKAEPVPATGFTAGIEGPACDAEGNLYAVAYEKPDNIGRVAPDGKAELFVTLPNGSFGNGIVFDRDGKMFVADYTNHNILQIDPKTKAVSVFAHESQMNQPNDLAIASDGTLYASDPNWGKNTGQVWKVTRDGTISRFAGDLGTTNGIEVSPDGKTLYVNESVQRNIWKFDLTKENPEPKLLKQFADFGMDGMRCDVDGNLYVTRHGKGTVVKLSPQGEVLEEIDVLGKSPTNLCFGGPDGCTVYVTEGEKARIVKFRADRPGLDRQRWKNLSHNHK